MTLYSFVFYHPFGKYTYSLCIYLSDICCICCQLVRMVWDYNICSQRKQKVFEIKMSLLQHCLWSGPGATDVFAALIRLRIVDFVLFFLIWIKQVSLYENWRPKTRVQ